jgi:hypothetical protein
MRVGCVNADLFWAKVQIGTPNECWLWTAGKFQRGYGGFSVAGSVKKAHRISLALCGVDVPDDAFVCHKCDNPSCVNPSHLFVGSPKDNTADMIAKGRKHSLKGTKVDPNKTIKGDKHGRAKLNVTDVLAIRQMLEAGMSQSQIAKTMNVSQTCISKISRRARWKHIE